ncbi:MAG TPA: pantoate--beta-alanine ligase [Caulobacteraceae bacterium]
MPTLPIVRSRADLRARVAAWRAAGERVALAPTMGALHQGHLSLVGIGKANADHVVSSLFVNPTQFSPAEDFDAYPRNEAQDAELLAQAGCELLYAPTAEEMYPLGFSTAVTVANVSQGMEGAARPHHFGGVATVVTKLLTQCAPDVAVFGEKDYQQLQVIRRLTRDLDLPVEIIGGPTVRADDGLALSSRNAYLSPEQRQIAPALIRALRACAQAVAKGAPVSEAETAAIESILAAGFDSVDYLEVRSAEYLERLGPGPIDAPARVLTAARLGRTRLLDNVPI